MVKNKILKRFLIFLGSLFALILVFVAIMWLSIEHSKKMAVKDGIEGSKICDTITIVNGASLHYNGFSKGETNVVKFSLIRNARVIRDTTITYKKAKTNDYSPADIPFDSFLRTDTVIVEMPIVKRYFYISNFQYYVYLHYGAVGYVGSYECRFDDDNYTINGKPNTGILVKKEGITEKILPGS